MTGRRSGRDGGGASPGTSQDRHKPLPSGLRRTRAPFCHVVRKGTPSFHCRSVADVTVFSLNPGVLATPISRYFVKGALGDSLASLIMPIALVANTLIAKVVVGVVVVVVVGLCVRKAR